MRLSIIAVQFTNLTFVSNVYTRLDLTATRDRLGNWTYFAYNPIRQRTAVTNALGNTTLFNYCACGSLDSIVNALSNTNSFHYDLAGRHITTMFPDGSWTSNRYDRAGRVIGRSESSGLNITNWFYNQGLLAASSNIFGQITRLRYDIDDRTTNYVDANGVDINLAYDDLDRVISRSYPDNGVERFGYSVLGLIAHTNELTKVTRFFYDAAHRKTRETNANNEVTQFTYLPAGDLLTLTDGKSQVTTWNYDLFGRATNKLDAVNAVVLRYKYDANGRLTNRWSAAKGDTFYSYDAVDNLTSIDYPASPDITLAYDAFNRVTNMVDAVGMTAYTYTSFGALQQEDGPWPDDTVMYSYAANGLRSGATVLQPNASSWMQSYGYDAGRRLSSITSPAGTFTYGYHTGFNSVASSSALIKSVSLPGGAVITNAFDNVGRLTETRLRTSGGVLLNQHDYVVNAGHQRTRQTRTSSDFVDYTYDNIGQLKIAQGKESGGTTNRLHEQLGYAYDAAGNLAYRTNNTLLQTFKVNSLNQLTNVLRGTNLTLAGFTTSAATNVTVNGATVARYADLTFSKADLALEHASNPFTAIAQDNLGRTDTNAITFDIPPTITLLFDQNGNLRTNDTRIFEYDDENQLTRVTEPAGWKSEFTYDARMRMRVSKDFEWVAGSWVQVNEMRRVYDGMLVIQERDQFNVPRLRYTRGRDLSGSMEGAGGIGGLLAMTENSASGHLSSYFQSDGNGNVTCLVDTNQNVVARYLYDPFGNTLSSSGPKAALNKFRFSTKEWHEQSAMLYYGYRWYIPSLQRWLNRDPIGELGGRNLYGHVENNPANLYDSDGRQAGPFGTGPINVNPRPNNNPNIDPVPHPNSPDPSPPPGLDMEKNAEEARKHRLCPPNPLSDPAFETPFDDAVELIWFRNQVKKGGPWDIKAHYGDAYGDFGNFHFGYMGQAMNLDLEFMLRSAGYAESQDHPNSPQPGDPGMLVGPVPNPFSSGTPPYADKPRDQFWIQRGFEHGQRKSAR